MGIVSNKGFLQSFEQIEQIEDAYFGNISIYHSTELNKYIFKACRTYIVNEPRHLNFLKQVKCLKQLHDNPTIMPLLYHETKQYRNFCVDYQIVQLYCEYFNFTLADMLRTGKGLEISQIWLCLQQLLTIVESLSKLNLEFQFDLGDLFITLKGNISLYPICFQFSQLGSTHKFLKNIVICILKLTTNSTSSSISSMFSQLQNASHYKNLVKFLQYMLEAENNSQIFTELLEGLEQMRKNGIIKIANQIKLNKFRYIIPTSENSQPDSSNTRLQKQQNQKQPMDTVAIGKTKPKQHAHKLQNSENANKIDVQDIKNYQKKQIEKSSNKLQQPNKSEQKQLSRTNTNLENLKKLKKQLQKFQTITPIGLVKRSQPPKMLSELEQKKNQNLANRAKMQQRRKQLLQKTSASQTSSLQASNTRSHLSKNKQNNPTLQPNFKSSKKIGQENRSKKNINSHNKIHCKSTKDDKPLKL